MPGCGKRYTDPSSLRKHAKNHTDLGYSSSAEGGNSNNKSTKGHHNNSSSRRHSSSSSVASCYPPQPISRNPSVTSDYGSQKDPLDVLDEIEFKLYPTTVSPQAARVPNNMDDGHEYIPYESVAKFLVDDRSSQFGFDSIGEYSSL